MFMNDAAVSLEPTELSDEEIIASLRATDSATLLMSLIHLTGDYSILDGDIRPKPLVIGGWYEARLAPEEEELVRQRVFEALKDIARTGKPLPPPPPLEIVDRMIDFYVGGKVDAEYTSMLAEELELDGVDGRAFHWRKPIDKEALQDFKVIVIGAGMSGLLAAKRLKDAGIPFVVVEKNDGVGGTWYENQYPGCRVDVGNHFYSYSFAPGHQWSCYFTERDELAAYYDRFMREQGLTDSIRFRTEAVAAEFSEGGWSVTVRDAAGREDVIRGKAVISAVGQLNRPKFPDLPGRDEFAGVSLHSAQWDRSLDLAGKRVAVVGTGASAFQIVPEIAKTCASVTVFQRQPPWMKYNPRYHDKIEDGKRWALEHLPGYSRWYRFLLFWHLGDATLPALMVEPDWPDAPHSLSAANARNREALSKHIMSQVEDDPELLAKVLPNYPPGGKRMLQDNGSWLQALKQDHVELVTTALDHVQADGLVDAEGRHYPVDVIIYATGFNSVAMLAPMKVAGRDGQDLHSGWTDGPEAYLGIAIPGFPNFFCVYGPGANLTHGGSIIFVSECQVRYILNCLRELIERDYETMEVTDEAFDEYMEKFDEAAKGFVMAHPSVNNWYKTASGRMVTNWPWRMLDMWQWTREVDPDAFRFE